MRTLLQWLGRWKWVIEEITDRDAVSVKSVLKATGANVKGAVKSPNYCEVPSQLFKQILSDNTTSSDAQLIAFVGKLIKNSNNPYENYFMS